MISNKMPNNAFILIIGAMKSGTSSLYNYLIEHPSICPCRVKEPEYFSCNQGHKYNVEKYDDLWSFNPSIHKYALEASTGYTKYPMEPNVPGLIFKYGINPKFIYIVRNPFDRGISHYNHLRYKCNFGSRKQSLVEDELIFVSKYFLQLKQYRTFFSKDQLYIVDFDDIKNDPLSVLIGVFKFLDISISKSIRSDQRFSQKNKTHILSKFEMFMKRNPVIRKMYSLLPQIVRERGEKAFTKYYLPEEPIKYSEQEKKIIYDCLSSDMRKFYDEYGFNVKKWGF